MGMRKLDYNCYEFSQKYLNFIITSQSLSVKEKFKHIDDWFERKLNAPAAYQDIVLYHCTLSENDILGEGFKPPINENKNFFNSRTGHVYFSLNPGIALDVAFIAFKKLNGLSVYKASIPVKKLCPDYSILNDLSECEIDMLKNQYMGIRNIGNSLAESLVYTNCVSVKGKIHKSRITLECKLCH